MKLNTQTISTALSLLVTFGLMLAVAAIVVVVKETRDTTTLLGNTAHLSQELRQSSDDLTRFIRTFTVTGNESYWNFFQDVINIRNGAIPLPIDPWRNHWDLFIVDGVAPRGFGAPSSLRARIKDALFTTDEIALLDLAQSRSDALIDLEDVANNAMRGKYRPTNTVGLTAEQAKAFSVVGTPNQTLAMELVHGVDYHREKGGIMKPLDDFAAKAAKRVQDRADLVFFISIALAVLVAVLSFISATVAVMTHRYQGRQLEEALHLAETVSRKLATYDTTGARADLEAALALALSKSAMAKRRAFQESKSTAMGCENANGESGGASVSRVMTDAAEPRVVFADDLEVAEPDADVSSPVLLIANALSTITDNMTLFRPHLPGWLIEQVQMSEVGDDGDGDESPYDLDATMTASRVAGSHQSHPAADRFNNPSSHSNGATTGVAPTDDTPTTRRSHQTTALAQSPLLSSPTTLTCTTRTSLSTSWQSSIRARGLRPSVAAGGGGAHAGGHAGFKFNATLAGEIHRIVLCQLVFEIHSASNFAEVMHAVSDAVHGAATKTSAAVHGFACDTVMVSWGAARKVVQPDAKAASFMLKVRAALEGNEHVTISAAALSGEARPMLAGRGNQQALSVYTLWRPALEAAAAYARTTKSLVVGRGADRDAKYVATIRPIAAIATAKPGSLQDLGIATDDHASGGTGGEKKGHHDRLRHHSLKSPNPAARASNPLAAHSPAVATLRTFEGIHEQPRPIRCADGTPAGSDPGFPRNNGQAPQNYPNAPSARAAAGGHLVGAGSMLGQGSLISDSGSEAGGAGAADKAALVLLSVHGSPPASRPPAQQTSSPLFTGVSQSPRSMHAPAAVAVHQQQQQQQQQLPPQDPGDSISTIESDSNPKFAEGQAVATGGKDEGKTISAVKSTNRGVFYRLGYAVNKAPCRNPQPAGGRTLCGESQTAGEVHDQANQTSEQTEVETVVLFEVVAARHDALDEWLYVVDGGDEHQTVIEKSVERVLEDPSSAVEVLGAMQALPEEVLQTATVQWLLGRLQAIADGQADSIVF